jgi:endogenous inhibitor of DNA gyrase (YacG/DUF329 family)
MTDGAKPGPRPSPQDKVKLCPVCSRPAVEAHKPFCSARCKDVDLNRWLGGVYAVPGKTVDEEED